MRAGISTACLYPMLLEDAFSELLKLQFHEFEIFINTFSELKPDYVRELRLKAKDTGSRIKSLHPFTSGFESFMLFSDYERRFLDGLEIYKRYFEVCNLLGAEIFVLHGKRSEKRSPAADLQYYERYVRLFQLGKKFGVTVAQENVNNFLSDDPSFIFKMKEHCGENCAFVLDIKQAVRGGQDPYRICAAMGDRIVHVHMNDNMPGSDCVLPGCGTMNYPALIRMLEKFSFDGDLIIEVYRKNFTRMEELVSAKHVVEELL
ncbi:sugar phosphate isomerase/epimerase family protein [Caproicibacter sp.]|uniref:sugar phosphate isomerase/epimerase family protein n=1 Tax=Caproicibacter sp. TaxID=2814884 RepID=UPI003988E44A